MFTKIPRAWSCASERKGGLHVPSADFRARCRVVASHRADGKYVNPWNNLMGCPPKMPQNEAEPIPDAIIEKFRGQKKPKSSGCSKGNS